MGACFNNTNLPALFVAQNQPYPHLRVNKEPKTVARLDGEQNLEFWSVLITVFFVSQQNTFQVTGIKI